MFVLLIGAGLMLTSFQRVRAFDPGFETRGLLTMRLAIPRVGVGRSARLPSHHAHCRIGAYAPRCGVGRPELAPVQFGGGYLTTRVVAEAQPLASGEEGLRVYRQFVTPGYFAALGLTVESGRQVTARDTEDTPPVAVVSASFAQRLWPAADPIGRRFRFGSAVDAPLNEVVGVVGDVRPEVTRSASPVAPQVYTPMAQSAFGQGTPGLLVRTASDPAGAAALVRETIRSVAPEVPAYQVTTMRQSLAERTALDRFSAWLMGLLGGLALLLATVGVSGVMGQVVAHRTREIGIRLALGADPRAIVQRLLRQGLGLTVVGLAIGWAAATALSRLIAGRLYQVSPTDPRVFAAVALVLTGAVLVACYLPARRAAAIDPIATLRGDR